MLMTSDNDKNLRGFAGLSGLASVISIIDEPVLPESEADNNPSKLSSQSQQVATPSETGEKDADSPPIKSVEKNGGLGLKLILAIIIISCAVFVIWLTCSGDKDTLYRPPSFLQSDSYPKSSPDPGVQTSGTPQGTGLSYIKPPVGTSNLLSVAEIRWCIRESIRIEAMRDVVDNDVGISEFNRIVDDYNSRCASYRYRNGSLSQAKRDVAPYQSQIVAEAIHVASQWGRSHFSVDPDISTSSTLKNNAKYIKAAQQLLMDLGYAPGPVDGKYGRQTVEAVKDEI